MKRYVIMTVGKTHSGKTTFAYNLESKLDNAVVMDQDNHAAFLNRHYKNLQPKHGPNIIKHSISITIVDYVIQHTDFHLIISNSNRSRQGRLELLNYFHESGFASILVYFAIPDEVLRERVEKTTRSTSIFRQSTSFLEVLDRQQNDSLKSDITSPTEDEADNLFIIRDNEDVAGVFDDVIKVIGQEVK